MHFLLISYLKVVFYTPKLKVQGTVHPPPNIEQAGAQRGRGCIEQILTIRLLIDLARKKGLTLYIAFIDYVKAYDKINRNLLLTMLAAKGCGDRFLKAIGNSLKESRNLLGEASFSSTSGVRQGGSTSCSLFTLVIDYTINKMREIADDGWLAALHMLLLMDDTAVLATSRERMLQKLLVLQRASIEIGAEIHLDKSYFLAINAADLSPFTLENNVVVGYKDLYGYLGSPVSNKRICDQVKDHVLARYRDITKFSAFIAKNKDAPYSVKKTVWNSAIMSAVLYSCETWLTRDLSAVNSAYRRTIKEMLGVRQSTQTNMMLLEAGLPDAKPLIFAKQKLYLDKLRASPSYHGSPVQKAITLAQLHRSPMGNHIAYLDSLQVDPRSSCYEQLQEQIRSSDSTRSVTYRALNPSLSVHPMYSSNRVIEHHRISTTRLRLSSHYLKVETGRWSRINYEDRTCVCGVVQDEAHVLLSCQRAEHLRERFIDKLDFTDLPSLMESDPKDLTKYCDLILNLFTE